ncbi:deoxyribose-phosphate aldolase [Loigolactobacillus binensis]|uniref:Deoxyribose-phosphate aldolase n=1 Tax=Loigolactobacillus binensis TaxID=2559922 RepID=A0ABW3EEE9_9LACO|nr:deoxyribose-phosphate aldolase [Loigolactobacillus binensis]
MKFEKYIDHTLLKPDATESQIAILIQEAQNNHFATVMVNPYWVAYAHKQLQGSDVKVATVIGFPLGANTTAVKIAEAKQAISDDAQEIDMVQNIGELKAGHLDRVAADIAAVVTTAHDQNILVKVIIETALLTEDEIVSASKIVAKVGADFVKTSTGFSTRGASVRDIELMYGAVGDQIKVKAAGGIHTAADAKALISAGASRLGTSSSMQIITVK